MRHLAGCPKTVVPAAIWELTELAELFEKGLPPVPGGVLDQADAFVTGCRIFWNEQARQRAKQME